ncbi:MAG: class I SAM-dependent methyltransferase [Bacteroidales bacterium]|nr:class I SAM-dependent methyltransferase [Bacteroidales bacterium]
MNNPVKYSSNALKTAEEECNITKMCSGFNDAIEFFIKTSKMIKSEKVKTFFDEDVNYSDSNFCIKVRKDFISNICQNKSFKSIIDIGCGTGELSIPFLSNKNSLTLIDISEKMLERASQKFRMNLMTILN